MRHHPHHEKPDAFLKALLDFLDVPEMRAATLAFREVPDGVSSRKTCALAQETGHAQPGATRQARRAWARRWLDSRSASAEPVSPLASGLSQPRREIPFDAAIKMMATEHDDGQGARALGVLAGSLLHASALYTWFGRRFFNTTPRALSPRRRVPHARRMPRPVGWKRSARSSRVVARNGGATRSGSAFLSLSTA